jgi:hypothetical protein
VRLAEHGHPHPDAAQIQHVLAIERDVGDTGASIP